MPIKNGKLTINIDYEPLDKQKAFHISTAKYRLYIGAWRAGKTFAGCYEAYKQSILYPKNCGVIGRKDYTDLRDTTMKTFFDVVPEEEIKSYNKTEHRVVLLNGSEIYFRELKDGAGLGSLNLGWFYIDEAEEVQESIFDRLKGRLSLQHASGRGWLTSNPPNEDHWIFKQFEENPDPMFETFHASTYENKDNLPQGYIISLEKLPPSWRKKYLEGQYGFTPDGTPYYEGYVETLHKQLINYDPSQTVHCGWDFGKQRPAFVATQVTRSGQWNILHEILGANIGIHKFADLIVLPTMARMFPGARCIHYGDPACNQVSDKSEQTTFQILLSKGILIHSRPSEYRLRKEIIEKKINTITNGMPNMVVHPNCRIINDAFLGGYHYPTYSINNQFTEKYDNPYHDNFYSHLMNALEYIAIHIFSPIDRANKRVQRPELVESMSNI